MKPVSLHTSTSQSEHPAAATGVRQEIDEDVLSLSVSTLGQGSALLTRLVQLATAEMQLAAGSLVRMLLLAITMGLLLICAWMGLSVLISWSFGAAVGSVLAGMGAFLAVQCLALGAALRGMRHLAHMASMPETRGQIARLVQEVKDDDSPTKDSTSP